MENFYITSSAYETEFWNALRQHHAVDTGTYKDAIAPFTKAAYLPEKQARKFRTTLDKECFFRFLGTVMFTPEVDSTVHTISSEAEAEWVVNGGTIPEDEDILNAQKFEMHKLASIAKVHEDLLVDKKFNLEDFIIRHFVRRFARAEDKAFILGNGKNQPTGILADNGGAEIGVTAANGVSLTFDEVMALFHSVKPEFREKAVWVMNDDTALALHTLKDEHGNYLRPSATEKLLGKNVIISNAMPGIASGAKTIAFGDFSYYWIVKRIPLVIRALYVKYILKQTRGYVGYEHLDGKLIRTEAIKVIKMAE